ncbi:paralemmin-3 isoform X3 [Eulemur rufifrons]|uniref:paralemmin-3 isoform X3 n=1 Tax=Eulemur rufifrons TaxID=859984 RepID=UPI0037420267
MALQSQVWSPATPMPMAESSLYRQRLEVIAEKRRLQEQIRAARRELEEEKLRVERLKRKSLRERWLMDGAAEGPERPEDPTSKDPQSPEGQAQARIQNLQDSLFTLQSQLQLLQGASTGAQHKPPGRPSWRRQGHRPLSQPTVDVGPEGHTDVDNKRASLPAGPVGVSPESPCEPREEVVGILPAPAPAPRQVPGAVGASSEANGPYPGPSPAPERELSQGAVAGEGRVGEASGGGVVKVVWEGLRATEDGATGVTRPELEAKVEEVVLEAIGDRQGVGLPELPAWVREDRGVVEVVWEGVGGSDSEATGAVGGGPEAAQTRSPRLPERPEVSASGEGDGAPRSSPEGAGQGGSGGEEGSFIWVERVTLSEEWEELLVEGLEGPVVTGREGGDEGSLGTERAGGEETWEAEQSGAEESTGPGEKGGEEKPGPLGDRVETSLAVETKGSEESLAPESRGGSEEKQGTEMGGGEEPWGVERNEGEGPLRAEKERGEEKLGVEEEVEEPLRGEKEGGEEKPEVTEEPLVTEEKGGEETAEAERKGGEGTVEAEKTGGAGEDLNPEEQKESREGTEYQAEEVSEAGTPLGADKEPRPEEGGLKSQEKQEGSLEEAAVKLQAPAEGQGPSGDATPLLAETPAPEQPAECQPLLQGQGPSANPSARAVPTYAPARQPEPPAPTEGEEASGPKQKTCQCCVVM